MKRFSFSMQKILDIREFTERQAQIELGQAVAEVNRINEELEAVAQEKLRMLQINLKSASLNEFLVHENYMKRLELTKERLLEELAAAQLVVDEKREIFAEAMKQRKILSNLKEKQFAQYKKEALVAEDNAVDDLVTSRHGYNKDY
ncbi:MAG: flagellar export protein FliJ [Spirochaetaceae bacterium]|jgi:flagellar FliJ protein|nr:flagellar export protein FliJ [Spirochaetaceae bacterium]